MNYTLFGAYEWKILCSTLAKGKSARCREMEMCPFRAACKTSATRGNPLKGTMSAVGVPLATSGSAKRKGVIAGHEVPLRPRCAIFARLAELAENTLAVLRRSRPWLTQKGVVFSLLYAEIGKLKIFLSPRLFHPFPLLLALFSKTRQFQITPLSSTTYLKNAPLPTPLQRLPRSKKSRCDPL